MDSRFVNVIESCAPGKRHKMLNITVNAETKQESNEIESKLQNLSGMYGSAQKSAIEQLSKDMDIKRKMRERLHKKKANK